ncbi:MAG: 16S rRNA (guanine(527)-N(7))-methyltransferase RsmG [Pseudomonadales bacterium]
MASLVADCQQLGLTLTQAQTDALDAYVALLNKWNKTFNLISRQDISRVVPRHVLDSLAGHRWIRGKTVLDVGSGAGLPGIPLAVVLPEVHFTLCDRMARRSRFQSQVVRELKLDNVEVLNADVAAIPVERCFSTIVARAVDAAPELWKLVKDRLPLGGALVVYSSTQVDDTPLVEFPGGEAVQHQVTVPGMNSPHAICEIKKR